MVLRRGACIDITCERPSLSQLARVSRSSSGVIHVARVRGPHIAATAAAITTTCSGGIAVMVGAVVMVDSIFTTEAQRHREESWGKTM